MPSTDRKLELIAKTSVAQTGSQPYVYAKELKYIQFLVHGDVFTGSFSWYVNCQEVAVGNVLSNVIKCNVR
jgi:hypothetical protein